MQGSRKRCGRWRRGSSADGAARHRNGALANRSSAGFCLGYVHATGILVRPWQWRACAEKGSDCGRDALRLSDVGDLAAANAFLPKDLAGHNARFAVMSENEADAHVSCAGEVKPGRGAAPFTTAVTLRGFGAVVQPTALHRPDGRSTAPCATRRNRDRRDLSRPQRRVTARRGSRTLQGPRPGPDSDGAGCSILTHRSGDHVRSQLA